MLVGSTIWWFYFKKSKRVKATSAARSKSPRCYIPVMPKDETAETLRRAPSRGSAAEWHNSYRKLDYAISHTTHASACAAIHPPRKR